MDIHLTQSPYEASVHGPIPLRIFLNGALQCESFAGQIETREDLEALIRQARCLQALANHVAALPFVIGTLANRPDPINKTPDKRLAAWLRGFAAGIAGDTVPSPGPEGSVLPGLPPDQSPSGEAGYCTGQGLRRALQGSQTTTARTQGEQ
jgi:hypothetical protein